MSAEPRYTFAGQVVVPGDYGWSHRGAWKSHHVLEKSIFYSALEVLPIEEDKMVSCPMCGPENSPPEELEGGRYACNVCGLRFYPEQE